MRSITIDFTKSPVGISSTVLGKKGEKNATQLIITPPAEMSSEASGIVSYSVAFQIGANRKKHSAVYEKAETIIVPLELAVTQVNVLSLQLEGYDGEENLIMKSERIDNLLFDASVDGEEYNGSGESNLGAQVAANTAKLADFSTDENGNLLYKGKPVSSERPTATTTEFEGYRAIWYDFPHTSCFTVLDIENLWPEIPIGAEIKTIEIKLGSDGEWVDIHRMNEVDGIPYTLNMNRVFDGDSAYTYGKIFAMVTPTVMGENYVHTAMSNGDEIWVRITYYTDGGESNE